jgi:hypothetical protein
MAPRKHVAKSQEHVYKPVGKGSRQRYKLTATDILPRVASGSSTAGVETESVPRMVPIVSPPSADAMPPMSADIPYFSEDYGPRQTRNGRVNCLLIL